MGLVHLAKNADLSQFAPLSPGKPGKPASSAPSKKKKPGAKRPGKSAIDVLRLQDPQHALLCAPADYIDCRHPIDHIRPQMATGEEALFRLTFTGISRGFGADKKIAWHCPSEQVPHLGALSWPKIKNTKRTELEFQDAHGNTIYASFFRVPREWADRRKGEEVLALGRLQQFGSKLSLDIRKEAPDRAIGKIWAQYAGLSGQIAGERIEILVNSCVDNELAYRNCAAHVLGETGMADADLMEACGTTEDSGFQSVMEVLEALHRPVDVETGLKAIDYAKRISAIAIQAAALRHHVRRPHPKAPLVISPTHVKQALEKLPNPLTEGEYGQKAVVDRVLERLQQPTPMSGLLSGDVGTGKTRAFLIPAIAAHLAGARVTIITPRTLLADQIARELLQWDGLARCERVETGGKIKDTGAILVGTQGLATVAAKAGYAPQFLICDEQHKFSTDAREALVADYTHVLEVSATPVPRSLAAALYEGMEILNLKVCPVQKKIHSEVMDMETRGKVIAGIRHVLKNGGRAAVVYPTVNTDEESDGQSVTKAFESFDKAFPGLAVMLHGEMSDDEMRRNIDMLRSGERRLVIASTVLEIGIDIPSVQFLAVRDADRFGISQLHQLRGRLVRNGGEGWFMMVVENLEKTPLQSVERLEAVASTTDGYKLAELDLVQRGFGELDGTAQSGDSVTVFRGVKLNASNFLARKLKTLNVEQGDRQYNQAENSQRARQERLI